MYLSMKPFFGLISLRSYDRDTRVFWFRRSALARLLCCVHFACFVCFANLLGFQSGCTSLPSANNNSNSSNNSNNNQAPKLPTLQQDEPIQIIPNSQFPEQIKKERFSIRRRIGNNRSDARFGTCAAIRSRSIISPICRRAAIHAFQASSRGGQMSICFIIILPISRAKT